jgi:hypothetical protein
MAGMVWKDVEMGEKVQEEKVTIESSDGCSLEWDMVEYIMEEYVRI